MIRSEYHETDLFMEGKRGTYRRWVGDNKWEQQGMSNLIGKMGKGVLYGEGGKWRRRDIDKVTIWVSKEVIMNYY